MQYKIFPPEKLNITVQLPASKSISNRLLILNALSLNANPIENLSDCEDTQVIIDAFNSASNIFDVKGAGTAMRFLTAFLASMEGEWTIKGSARMHERPISPLVETLRALGAEIEYLGKEGFPPLKIKGKRLRGGEVYISGNISSQFLSALTMIAPGTREGVIINIQNELISKPYLSLTIKLMEQYGINVKWENDRITIKPQKYKPANIRVESDWSAASYWYEMVALMPKSEVTLLGLQKKQQPGRRQPREPVQRLGRCHRIYRRRRYHSERREKNKKIFPQFQERTRFGSNFRGQLLFPQCPVYFFRNRESSNQRDRSHRSTRKRTEKIGIHPENQSKHRNVGMG